MINVVDARSMAYGMELLYIHRRSRHVADCLAWSAGTHLTVPRACKRLPTDTFTRCHLLEHRFVWGEGFDKAARRVLRRLLAQ